MNWSKCPNFLIAIIFINFSITLFNNLIFIFFNKYHTKYIFKGARIMANEVFLTKEGYKELEQRLDYLKTTARVDVANKIEVARSFGDISENSEYDAAREEEALVEQEIQQITNTLRNAKIITKVKTDNGKVTVGCTVELLDLEYKDELTFKIMGSFESDPTKGLISNESPLGKALIGKEKGDIVEVVTPQNIEKYKILSVKA